MRKVNKKIDSFYSNLFILLGVVGSIGFFIIGEIIYFVLAARAGRVFFTDATPKPLPDLQPWIIGGSLFILVLPILIKYLKKQNNRNQS